MTSLDVPIPHGNRRLRGPRSAVPVVALMLALALLGCSRGSHSSRVLIQNKGSDTMVNIAQSWAEHYRTVKPGVAVAVSGGGSGTGIAALINGTVDIANASRAIKPSEQAQVRKAHGKEAVQHTVAADAVIFFVHPDNPLASISLEQLACIYGEGGRCEKWGSMDVKVPGCAGQEIIRVSRQSNSGTYVFVREKVLGKQGDFKLGSRDMQGNKDVVDLVSHTPCAIGYSGLGYATPKIKVLCLAAGSGEPCVVPSRAAAASGRYPLARSLYMYTLGEPSGVVGEYLEWIKSKEAQQIVANKGFIPIN